MFLGLIPLLYFFIPNIRTLLSQPIGFVVPAILAQDYSSGDIEWMQNLPVKSTTIYILKFITGFILTVILFSILSFVCIILGLVEINNILEIFSLAIFGYVLCYILIIIIGTNIARKFFR
jgi:hypothetical protein